MSQSGRPVYMDKNAYEADGIIVSCRLKPHNAFRGKVESGPCKMMAVGLGKQKGAENVHADGMGKIAEHIPSMAQVFLEKAPSCSPSPPLRMPMMKPAKSWPSIPPISSRKKRNG